TLDPVLSARIIVIVLFVVPLVPLVARAQESPRVEIFAGYALYNGDADQRHNFSGGELNFKFNIRPTAAFVVDAGGQYRSDPNYNPPDLSFFNFHDRYLHAYQLLIGPEFTRRRENNDLFFHATAGLVHSVARVDANNFVALGL